MTFVNPLMLWGLAASAIPVIIHLWGRRRPQRQPFPSIMLLRAGKQQQKGLSRVREWLLLILRVLMIALASLALSEPIVNSDFAAKFFGASQRATVILDASASMGYEADDGTVMQRGITAAKRIIDNLPAGSRPTLLAAENQLRRLKNTRDGLDQLQAGPCRSRIIELLKNTRRACLRDPRSRIFIISDLQMTGFHGRLSRPLPGSAIIVDVSAAPRANRAITAVTSQTTCPLVGRPVELAVRVHSRGQSSDKDSFTLSARAGDRHLPGRSLPSKSANSNARFRMVPRNGGIIPWQFSLPEDTLPADNTRLYTQAVRRQVQAVVISSANANPNLISTALNPAGDADTNIAVSSYTWSDIHGDLPQADLMIIASPAPGRNLRQQIAEFVDAAGGLLLFSGPEGQFRADLLQKILDAPVKIKDAVSTSSSKEPLTLAHIDRTHPAVRPFSNPRAGNIFQFAFNYRRAIENAPDERVIATFSDGSPAIIATGHPDRHCIVVNTSIDDRWTDAPYMAAWVPLIHNLSYDVVGPPQRVFTDWYAGQKMHVPVPEGAEAAVTITAPDASETEISAENETWVFRPTSVGFYHAKWNVDGEENSEKFAVNVAPTESDMSKISRRELSKKLQEPDLQTIEPQQPDTYVQRSLQSQANLAWPLLLLTLILFVTELALSEPRPTESQ